MFNIGGYNSAFLPFFRDFEILGRYSGFANFSSFNDFVNFGVYSGLNENLLKQFKTRIRKLKINKLCVHNEQISILKQLIIMYNN